MGKRLFVACLAALSFGASGAAFGAPFGLGFSLLPGGGVIAGLPGTLVGWGYAIDNTDTVNWFVSTGVSASSFALGTPDASFFDFPVVAPGSTASEAFDATLPAGLYGFAIATGALPGQSDSGAFTLDGEWWTGDPLGTGTFLRAADPITVSFRLDIGGAPAVVPEPASVWLLGGGLSLMAWRAQRGRKKGQQLVVRAA